jgi:hypothetical protein
VSDLKSTKLHNEVESMPPDYLRPIAQLALEEVKMVE